MIEGDEKQCDVLSVIDRPVGNKDRWVIYPECSQHISSDRKMFSSYTSVQGREVFMRNSATSKMISEGIIQFQSLDRCITTLQGVHHVLDSRYNLISLGSLHRDGLFQFER